MANSSVLYSKELLDLEPLRNRTVDLLLTMATPPRPERTACTESTAERSESTECTGCTAQPVHDSFHDQRAAPGHGVTPCERLLFAVRDRARLQSPGRLVC